MHAIWRDKTAFLTGGGSGIERALAAAMTKRGVRVVDTARKLLVIPHYPLRNTAGFLCAVALDSDQKCRLHSTLEFADRLQFYPPAHSGAGTNWRGKTYTVQSIVDSHLQTAYPDCLRNELRQQ
jgi:hypothetical protein